MTKKHFATRNFQDAGTERSFERGAELTDVKDGALANYVAAGLATTEKPQAPIDTTSPAAKPAA